MAARVLLVALVLIVLAVVGVAVWLAMQPAMEPTPPTVTTTAPSSAPLISRNVAVPVSSSRTLAPSFSQPGLSTVVDDARAAAGSLGLFA